MSYELREVLENKYSQKIKSNPELTRSLVSFQTNKKLPFYRWFKYKEGFSAPMMDYFIQDSCLNGKSKILDPFAGSGVALFSGLKNKKKALGIELLPVGSYIINNRISAKAIDLNELENEIEEISKMDLSVFSKDVHNFNHLTITQGAFPNNTEKDLLGFLNYCKKNIRKKPLRNMLEFISFCILEDISYTRKDGQYLRWDYRANRSNGNGKTKFSKGKIPSFKGAFLKKADEIIEDIRLWNKAEEKIDMNDLTLLEGSNLILLPEIKSNSFNLIITSPPYCNRYDYTRTYALELAFLGLSDNSLKELRQNMLTCTVENREKTDYLRGIYKEKRKLKDFNRILETYYNHQALNEIVNELEKIRTQNGLNNPNIVRMVKNYFFEMCFVIFEMFRVLKAGGYVYMVNDNVRYAGEDIPVDLILSDFASSAGFSIRDIWKLNVGKGNSSQQMGKHGRTELRKGVYVWLKAKQGKDNGKK